MGAGQSDLYKGTYGDNSDNIPNELKGKIELPKDDSQLKHIFRNAKGHLSDTPENRKLLQDLANDERFHVDIDKRGLDWNAKMLDDGSQLWVISRNGIIQNGGINRPPRIWNNITGFNDNPLGGK